jgi:hypothetical protein
MSQMDKVGFLESTVVDMMMTNEFSVSQVYVFYHENMAELGLNPEEYEMLSILKGELTSAMSTETRH